MILWEKEKIIRIWKTYRIVEFYKTAVNTFAEREKIKIWRKAFQQNNATNSKDFKCVINRFQLQVESVKPHVPQQNTEYPNG